MNEAGEVTSPDPNDGGTDGPPPAPASALYDYNPFFETLVEKTDVDTAERLIGMLAYAQYKHTKCNWVRNFRAKYNRFPTRGDMQTFIEVYFLEDSMEALRKAAESKLYQFADWYASERIEVEREELRNTVTMLRIDAQAADVKTAIARATGSWRSFWINIGASTVFTALAIVFAWIAIDQFGDFFRRGIGADAPPAQVDKKQTGR
ncbi:hypothetical protein [Tahibacter sp.]|uniref:hypothetical protein n=1 Tax=Tahibacter sp. TaxID=2056211 RepID=UPI0028C42B42|nr:hypothetical protein [Tahibacter sp.]